MSPGNVELVHECILKHLNMAPAKMKKGKDTEEEGKERTVNMERRTERKKDVPPAKLQLGPTVPPWDGRTVPPNLTNTNKSIHCPTIQQWSPTVIITEISK